MAGGQRGCVVKDEDVGHNTIVSQSRRLSTMSALKQEAIRVIERLPDDCSMDDIYYHLHVRECVLEGLADADAGRIVSHEEAMRRLGRWQTSSGRKQS